MFCRKNSERRQNNRARDICNERCPGARKALLGRPAIETLAIVKKVDAVEATDLKAKCPALFTGLGKRRGPDYFIKLTPEAKPFALSTPKKVPVSPLTKVKE